MFTPSAAFRHDDAAFRYFHFLLRHFSLMMLLAAADADTIAISADAAVIFRCATRQGARAAMRHAAMSLMRYARHARRAARRMLRQRARARARQDARVFYPSTRHYYYDGEQHMRARTAPRAYMLLDTLRFRLRLRFFVVLIDADAMLRADGRRQLMLSPYADY